VSELGGLQDLDELPLLQLEPDDEPVELGHGGWSFVRPSRRFRLLQVGVTAAVLIVLVLPVFALPIIEARLLSRFVALGVALLGLQFVVGQGGQLSLCHGVFVGIGSYTTTIAVAVHGQSHLVGLGLSPVTGFVAGCVVGMLALRIKATYLGPVTLSVAVAFPMIVKRFGWLTGGSGGLPLVHNLDPPAWTGIPEAKPYLWHHLVIVAIAIVAYLLMANLARSPVGLAVRAVADNPISAATSGINVRRARVLAYGVGAAFGALGGGLLVIDTPVVGADSYDLFRSLGYYAAVMVGGAATMGGALLGAGLLVGVPWFTDTYGLRLGPNLIFGLLLLGATLAAPGGLIVPIRSYLGGLIHIEERIEPPSPEAAAPAPPSSQPKGGPAALTRAFPPQRRVD
jgi:branched-chain amino acid transport system permease protein